jgi:phosphatidylserine/phosphatidylglycerophosphate/cardiolipin synthase-like enzyme
MLKSFIQKSFIAVFLTIFIIPSVYCETNNKIENHTQAIQSPSILSNHDSKQNTLSQSIYDLVNQAQESILLMSFTFSDAQLINILNQIMITLKQN